jgi:hypothetical protein
MNDPLNISLAQAHDSDTAKAALVSAASLNLSDHPDDYILRIDNSTLEKFQSCPRSAENYVIKRRTPPPSEPLVAGGALHQGLEHLYLHGVNPTTLPHAVAIAQQWYIDHPCNIGWRTPDLVTKALTQYVKQYENNDPFELVQHNGEPFVERSFEVSMGHIDIDNELKYTQKFLTNEGSDTPLRIRRLYIVWIGKIDLLIRDRTGLRVLDHKTTSMLGSTFYKQFELGQQPLGYVWAANKIFGEMPKGFMVNVIYWRPPLKNQASGRVAFERHPFNYTTEKVNEWEKDVMHSISDFVGNMVRGYFPGYRMWCVNKYGTCPYHDVCSLDNEKQRDTLLGTSLFSHVTWDPTKE